MVKTATIPIAGRWRGLTPSLPSRQPFSIQLCIYRDEQARKADLPHFKVLSNQLLIDLCIAEITTLDELENVAWNEHQNYSAGMESVC